MPTVLVVAHSNSLRALVYHLEMLSTEQLLELDLPTGIPFVYDFVYAGPDDAGQKELRVRQGQGMRFLGDEQEVADAIEKVKKQIKVNVK